MGSMLTDLTGLEQDCNCNAYDFTHVMGISGCHIENLCQQACSYCNSNCETGQIDLGIGATEYCGSVSSHADWHKVSACCGVSIINPDTGAIVPDNKLNP